MKRSTADAIVVLCIVSVVLSLTLVLDAMTAAATSTCSIFHTITGRCSPAAQPPQE